MGRLRRRPELNSAFEPDGHVGIGLIRLPAVGTSPQSWRKQRDQAWREAPWVGRCRENEGGQVGSLDMV